MNAVEATRTCLRKYAVFPGRAGRGEYCWFLVVAIAASLLLAGVDRLFWTPQTSALFEAIFALAIFLPLIAAGFRRLHDTGRPGWLMMIAVAASATGKLLLEGGLLNFHFFAPPVRSPAGAATVALAAAVPIFGVAALLALPSQPDPNRYGPNPHEVTP